MGTDIQILLAGNYGADQFIISSQNISLGLHANSLSSGTVTISGTARQGEVLTAANTLADIDGLDTISYQWKADGINITSATGSTYTLTQSTVGKVITVVASYTDQLGTAETVVSSATTVVANVNDSPTGTVTITGTARQGEVLTAANTLADIDGLGTISYEWKADGTNITSASGSTYTLTQSTVGKVITVVASYTDQLGTAENVVSSGTSVVQVLPSATYTTPISTIQSIGLSPDGKFLLIKVGGLTQAVVAGSSLDFNGSTVTTTDLTNQITPTPVFKSSGGSGGYALPELYTGPASLNLKYQLIENADNAVVVGGTSNDFIKVSSANSVGKAVDGGGGSDVIDGGVGSTFVSGGTSHNGSTFFLDGRAPGVSWSTITDFNFGSDQATIWGFVKGVSSVDTNPVFSNPNNEGAIGYKGLTLHFDNLLPDGQASGTNPNMNSITLSGHTLADIGVTSLQDLNNQIAHATTPNSVNQYIVNDHILIGQTFDSAGTHGYLFIH